MHLYIIHIRKITVALFVTSKKLYDFIKRTSILKGLLYLYSKMSCNHKERLKNVEIVGKGIPIGIDVKSFSSAC